MDHAKEIAFAVQKYFAIMKIPHDDVAKSFLQECQSASIKFRNKQYDYYRRGTGPIVVLIHGLHSNLGSMIPVAEDLLALGFQVILFDAPAHGEAPGSSTNLPQIRDFIHELGKQLGELAAIVGHSLGGMWALSSWGEDFQARTLVLISTPSNARFLIEKFIAINDINDEIAEGMFRQLERRFGESYWSTFSASNTARSVEVPGLIIHSRDDDFVPSSHAQQIHSNWNISTIEMLDGDEHFKLAESNRARKLIAEHIQRINQREELHET